MAATRLVRGGAAEGAPALGAPGARSLVAYYHGDRPHVAMTPSPRWRDWINAMPQRWANRCLPLVVANEAGWVLLNPVAFEARWDGGDGVDAVTLELIAPRGHKPLVASLFGYGIVTWKVPYLFRTPPGYNMLARGPANWPKDGACALEGLVETDWSIATFTMNWKLTRPGLSVRFEADEPFCMLVPQQRGELESFEPEFRSMSEDPALLEATQAWARRRHQLAVRKFLAEHSPEIAADTESWEGNYFRGRTPEGTPAPEHQTHLKLRNVSGFESRSK